MKMKDPLLGCDCPFCNEFRVEQEKYNMVDFHKPGTPWYCPVPKCENRQYDTYELLREHLDKAQAEGEQTHIDIIELEGWDETSQGVKVSSESDLEAS